MRAGHNATVRRLAHHLLSYTNLFSPGRPPPSSAPHIQPHTPFICPTFFPHRPIFVHSSRWSIFIHYDSIYHSGAIVGIVIATSGGSSSTTPEAPVVAQTDVSDFATPTATTTSVPAEAPAATQTSEGRSVFVSSFHCPLSPLIWHMDSYYAQVHIPSQHVFTKCGSAQIID